MTGQIVNAIEPGSHRCNPPGWWSRRRRRMSDGLVWECDCGHQYVLDHSSPRSSPGLYYHGSDHWPWIALWPDKIDADGNRYLAFGPPAPTDIPPALLKVVRVAKHLVGTNEGRYDEAAYGEFVQARSALSVALAELKAIKQEDTA